MDDLSCCESFYSSQPASQVSCQKCSKSSTSSPGSSGYRGKIAVEYVHWIQLTSSVTTSTWLQLADSFASKVRLQRATSYDEQFLLHLLLVVSGDPV